MQLQLRGLCIYLQQTRTYPVTLYSGQSQRSVVQAARDGRTALLFTVLWCHEWLLWADGAVLQRGVRPLIMLPLCYNVRTFAYVSYPAAKDRILRLSEGFTGFGRRIPEARGRHIFRKSRPDWGCISQLITRPVTCFFITGLNLPDRRAGAACRQCWGFVQVELNQPESRAVAAWRQCWRHGMQDTARQLSLSAAAQAAWAV